MNHLNNTLFGGGTCRTKRTRAAETLRKYPPVQTLVRVCTKPFRVPGTDVDLDVGTAVLIPVYAIHHDPQYYPEPDAFRPERFAKDDSGGNNNGGRPPGVYLPFGDGPRICIGTYVRTLFPFPGLTCNIKYEKYFEKVVRFRAVYIVINKYINAI